MRTTHLLTIHVVVATNRCQYHIGGYPRSHVGGWGVDIPNPQKGPDARHTHPRRDLGQGNRTPEGTWDQVYPQNGPETRDTHPLSLWTQWRTDECENITFLQLLLRAVKN